MPEQIYNKGGGKHYGTYPKGKIPPLLAYAFRPIFILLPAYITLSILLWGLAWSGHIHLLSQFAS